MYDAKDEPLITRSQFYWRLSTHVLIALLAIAVPALIGMLGFIYFEQIP